MIRPWTIAFDKLINCSKFNMELKNLRDYINTAQKIIELFI